MFAATIHSTPALPVEDKLRNVPESQGKSTDGATSSAVDAEFSPMNEFFDTKENWDKPEISVGRSWRKEDLRLKSNLDLHKLWWASSILLNYCCKKFIAAMHHVMLLFSFHRYVLLKERNMLLTMAEVYKFNIPPSPERIYKVSKCVLGV